MDHPPRLVLDEARPGVRLTLDPEDIQHLVKVLRLSSGASLEVLDGRGHGYAGILDVERRGAAVIVGSLLRETPASGAHSSPLPRLEVYAPWPKGNRAADAVGRLAQLGVAAWQPLVTAHTDAEARHAGDGRREKLVKVAREALKQCGGLHALQIRPVMDWQEAVQGFQEAVQGFTADSAGSAGSQGPTRAPDIKLQLSKSAMGDGEKNQQSRTVSHCNLVLDPYSPTWLSTHLERTLSDCTSTTGPTGFRLWAGPEAGFSPSELEALHACGCAFVRLSTQVLRIETALEAAAAIVLERCAARAAHAR